MELDTEEIEEKAQTRFPKGSDISRLVVVMFFVLVALITVFAVVAVQQIRVAQFNKRMHVVEDSVTRIEAGMEECVRAIRKYGWAREEVLDFSRQSDRGIEVGVGDRKR